MKPNQPKASKFAEELISISRAKARSALLRLNRARRKTYIPHPRKKIYIETSSICNLECKFCGYSKKSTPKTILGYKDFTNYINQALDMGFESFGLTPITGDIFTDPGIFEKLSYLENNFRVKEYSFFTNLINLNHARLENLKMLQKLKELSISIYGHDLESFRRLTTGSEFSYKKIVENLNIIATNWDFKTPSISIHLRTTPCFDMASNYAQSNPSDLIRAASRVISSKNCSFHQNAHFNNWGGLIDQSDLEGTGISLRNKEVTKIGPCSLIFYKLQIMADGRVNACACRDANATLAIGDLKEERLSFILSSKNDTYMQLINSQMKNNFNEICFNCDFYRSIYKYDAAYETHSEPTIALNDFRRLIDSSPNQ